VFVSLELEKKIISLNCTNGLVFVMQLTCEERTVYLYFPMA
jgi:hypothetical protein